MDKKTNYLKIDNAGKFYSVVSSDTPNATAVKTRDGDTVYRLYRKFNSTITGKVKRPYFKTVTFATGDVKMVYIFIENEVETDCISFPLFTTHGGVNPYIKSIAQLIEHLDAEKEYYFRPSTKVKKNGYITQTLFITEAATKEWVKLPDGVYEKRPQPVIKERADGKKIYDFSDQDKFIYDEFLAGIDKTFGVEEVSTTTNIQSHEKANPASTSSVEDLTPEDTVEDELPF